MLTGRDLRIVESIRTFGALDTQQITRLHFADLKPTSAATKARECMRRIRTEKDLGIQYEKCMYSGRLVYYTKKAQLRHKKLVAEFYIRLMEGPGKILEFETEFTVGGGITGAGSLRTDALAAYEVAGKVRLFCLEVHISNNKLDLAKYERICLGPDWIYPCLPVIVVVSDRQVKDRRLRGGIEVVQVGTDYSDFEKILPQKEEK